MIYKNINKLIISTFTVICILLPTGCHREPIKEENTNIEKPVIKEVYHKKLPTRKTTAKKHYPPSIPQLGAFQEKTAQKKEQTNKQSKFTSHIELLAWLKKIESIKNSNEKTIALKELGKDIGVENFKNALKLALTISDENSRRLIYKGIFEAQTELDPIGALKVAATLSGKTTSENDYITALLISLQGVATIDPKISLSYLDNIKSDRTKLRARIAIYTGWGKLDYNAAMDAAAELPENDQHQIIPAIFNGWAQTDVFSAINYANELENSSMKSSIIYNIANGYLEDKWDEYMYGNIIESEISQMPKNIQSRILSSIYRRWATSSPADAANHYIRNHNGPLTVKDHTLNNIIQKWAKLDTKEALIWAENTLDNDDDYVAMVKTIIDSIRNNDQQKVATLLEELPFTYEDDTAGTIEVYNLMASWTRRKPKEAIEWAESLNNRQLKIIATKSIATHLAERNYGDAIEWAENIQDSDMQAYAFSNIALKHSLRKLKHSDEWIESLPSGFIKTRTAAGYALGALWRSKDKNAKELFQQQLTDDELNPRELIMALETSNLDKTTKNRMIELLGQ